MDRAELLRMLSQNAHVLRFKQDAEIVTQGDPSTSGLCLMLQGEAKVQQEQGGQNYKIGTIQTGQFFGETALVLKRPRGATVIVTSTEAIVMFIDTMGFMKFGLKNATLLEMLIEHTIDRIEKVISSLIRHFPIPEMMVDPTLSTIIDENRRGALHLTDTLSHTRAAWIGVDKPIFSQDDHNDGETYLLVKGKVKAVRKHNNQEYVVFYLNPGDYFGYSNTETSPYRKYSALACDDSVRFITFDEDLLSKLLKINPESFFYIYRSMLTQLIIFDDALRLASARKNIGPNDPRTRDAIEKAFNEVPEKPIEEKEFEPEATVLFDVEKEVEPEAPPDNSIEETDKILEEQLSRLEKSEE